MIKALFICSCCVMMAWGKEAAGENWPSGALQRGKKQQRWQEPFKCAFFGEVFMMLTRRVAINYTENSSVTRNWAK